MKPIPLSPSTDSRAIARSRPRAPTSDDFLSPTESRALLASSQSVRLRRLEEGDMISTDEAAALTGSTRVTVNTWISKGRAIGLTQAKRGFRLPRWQFDAPLWDAIPKLSKAIGTTEGWALLAFLETPLGALDGATPRQVIERGGTARVVDLAAGGD